MLLLSLSGEEVIEVAISEVNFFELFKHHARPSLKKVESVGVKVERLEGFRVDSSIKQKQSQTI